MIIRNSWLVPAVVLLGIAATACTPDAPPTDRTSATTTTTTRATTSGSSATTNVGTTSTAPPVLKASIDWKICGSMECGSIDVPADYDDPGAGTISIAVNMLRAADTDRRLGSLFVNPGGPGASGLGFAEAFSQGFFPAELTDFFDIIGFDPRGVGESEPRFACGDSGQQLALLSDIVDIVDEPAETAAAEAAIELCTDTMGPLAGLLHTGFVARDMDEIRAAIGEEQISYLGFSYGSVIGVWYATLFPDRVRAMVIDGANNPIDQVSTTEERLESAREEIGPLSDLLGKAIDACADQSCPIYNDGDPEAYYYRAAAKLPLVNAALADNPDGGLLALITPLYNQATWPQLWSALADLEERDDPAAFAELATFQFGDDPGAVNFTRHVNCLDRWALLPEYDRELQLLADAEFFELEDELNADYPLLAAIEGGSASTCPFYDTIAPPPLSGPFDGGGVPIVVIGNISDPVTNFGESEELASEVLANGILVKVDHPKHAVYPGNACVNDVVHDVLLDVNHPDSGVMCASETGDVEEALAQTCLDVIAQQAPSLDDSRLQAVCDAFVDTALSRLGTATIEAALSEDDPDAGAALFDILIEEIAAAGG